MPHAFRLLQCTHTLQGIGSPRSRAASPCALHAPQQSAGVSCIFPAPFFPPTALPHMSAWGCGWQSTGQPASCTPSPPSHTASASASGSGELVSSRLACKAGDSGSCGDSGDGGNGSGRASDGRYVGDSDRSDGDDGCDRSDSDFGSIGDSGCDSNTSGVC